MVTIKDIAKIAGVSHSTVSRSLNDSSEISEKTKERIKKIAEELGFEFNNNARSLSTKKTGTIGIIFDKGFDQENASLFCSKLLKELRYSLERASFDAIIDFRANPFTGKNNMDNHLSAIIAYCLFVSFISAPKSAPTIMFGLLTRGVYRVPPFRFL